MVFSLTIPFKEIKYVTHEPFVNYGIPPMIGDIYKMYIISNRDS